MPYGWTLDFEVGVSNSAVFEEKMKAYSCMLIAPTDNLGQVGWTYTVELEDGPVQRSGAMTEQETQFYDPQLTIFARQDGGIYGMIGLDSKNMVNPDEENKGNAF